MKTIVPPPPENPLLNPALPDHRHLPCEEGGKPTEEFRGTIPDHTQLPDKDGTFVRNTFETWQNHLLTDSLWPVLRKLEPEGNFFVGEDCGIYWRLTEPPEKGVLAPDWYLVLGVPGLLEGQLRRSYVLWREGVPPHTILEFVSGDGSEERDRTPREGKFWVYENPLRAAFYGIYEVNKEKLEMYHSVDGKLVKQPPNERGRFPLGLLGVEIGVWHGSFANFNLPWLRWWDAQGNLLPTSEERAEKLAAKLRSLGVNPEDI
jgi:Uma2 family endonuclease